MSLEDDHCGECQKDPCVCILSAEQDAPKTPAGKRPLSQSQYIDVDGEDGEQCSDEGDDEVLNHLQGYRKDFETKLRTDERYSPEPDLDAYFDAFGLSAESRIAMCRTYANYLTQKLRSSGRLGPPRQKTLGGKPKFQKKLSWK